MQNDWITHSWLTWFRSTREWEHLHWALVKTNFVLNKRNSPYNKGIKDVFCAEFKLGWLAQERRIRSLRILGGRIFRSFVATEQRKPSIKILFFFKGTWSHQVGGLEQKLRTWPWALGDV